VEVVDAVNNDKKQSSSQRRSATRILAQKRLCTRLVLMLNLSLTSQRTNVVRVDSLHLEVLNSRLIE